MKEQDFNTQYPPTWCPGCGNFGIWGALKKALSKLNWRPDEFVVVYGIGCSGNMNDFVKSYGFHALHGRGVPNATGIHLANHKLPVICMVGDGDCYGEGGNHFIHAARGNFDINVLVHDNRVYGLTTGQVSPTASKGYKSKSTPEGIIEIPLNPLALGITQGATFVAQGFGGDMLHLAELMVKAFQHKGFSLVNVLQPCVTFNKVNTYGWYREKIFKLEDKGKKDDKKKALDLIFGNGDKIPLGVIYQEKRSTYEESLPQIKNEILVKKELEVKMTSFFEEFI